METKTCTGALIQQTSDPNSTNTELRILSQAF